MNSEIMVPFGKKAEIEKKITAMGAYASQPTIRRALRGLVPKKSKIKEYRLIRAIALESGGVEIGGGKRG